MRNPEIGKFWRPIVNWWAKPITVLRKMDTGECHSGTAEKIAELRAEIEALDEARLTALAGHAGRAAMLAGRVLRYGWEQRREPGAPTLRELLLRESDSLIAISKQICGLRAPKGADLN